MNYFKKFLQKSPLALSLWRAQEAYALSRIKLTPPLLDVGCGFGEFSSVFFNEVIDVGIDRNPNDIARAKNLKLYKELIIADARNLPLTDGSIKTAFSISTLEHIPNVAQVFDEVYRVLQPEGTFVFTVPTQEFNQLLLFPFFKTAHLKLFHKAFKHQPLISVAEWTTIAQTAGFKIIKVHGTISKMQVLLFQLFLPFSLPSLFIQKITGNRIAFSLPFRVPVLHALFHNMVNQENMTDANILVEVQKQ